MQRKTGLFVLLILVGLLPFKGVLAQAGFEPVRFNVTRFVIQGDNPIGKKADKVLAPYIGEQYGLEGLSAAADALEQAIIKAGFSFHRVSLLPQQLTSGTVEFQIVKFSIGKINVSGNKFFDQENIENSLPLLSSGTTPNTRALSKSLKLANNHASKNILLRFKEGGDGDTIDADIKVQDTNPQIFFVTLDNTGSEETKEYRSTLGYQHGNLFNKDHSLTATLTIAPEDPSSTTQIGLNYHMPLYQHGANLDFLVSDSEVNQGETGAGTEVTGKGTVIGATYTRPLQSEGSLEHQWSFGFQSKSFDNETLGVKFPVDSFPIILSYGFKNSLKSGAVAGGLSINANTGLGSNNSDEDYLNSTFTRVSSNSWSSIKYNFSYDLAFAKSWLFHFGLSGQNSGDLLIPGEQFGVGGSRSLRGFEERSVTGDSGYETSFELWAPPFAGLRFLLFIDMASLELANTAGNNDGADYDLSSFGVGGRWSWKQKLSVSLDVGVITKGGGPDTTINMDDDVKAHFSLIYRF